MKKLLQAFAVAFHIFLVAFVRFVAWIFMGYWLVEGGIFRWITIAYVLYLYFDYDGKDNYRRWDGLIMRFFFKLLRHYFPAKVKFLEDLEPNKNYFMIHHPHGVLFFGIFLTSSILSKINLRSVIATLNFNFISPITREYFMASGLVGVDEKTLKKFLINPEGGYAVNLLPGGAAEAALTTPGEYKTILKHRRGFCRIALETGAPLVPIFTFGEVDCLETFLPAENSLIWRLQEWVKNTFGPYPVIYKGSGMFSYYLTLPKRLPINVVVGRPIYVEKVESPSKEMVKALHDLYIKKLLELFNTEKYNYIKNPEKTELQIV